MNLAPILLILVVFFTFIIAFTVCYLIFVDKTNKREHNLHVLVENNRTDIIKKYTREDGELDQEHMLMDLAIQNQMIIESLENLKKLI